MDLSGAPGVFFSSFPVVTGDNASGSVVALGSGRVMIGAGEWEDQGMVVFLPTKEPMAMDGPVFKEGSPEYEAARANTVGGGAGSMLLFANLEAVDNLRRALDSVERIIRAMPPRTPA